jgi:hypothetical protein
MVKATEARWRRAKVAAIPPARDVLAAHSKNNDGNLITAMICFVVFYLLTPYQLRTEPMGRLNVVESQGDGTTVYDNNDDKAVGP